MLSYLKRVFSLDYRSLATLRIFVGATIFVDLVQRASSLTAHYTDMGVLTRMELLRLWNEPMFWSLYSINGSPFFVILLFFISGIFALMMMLGYKTRLATIASFILLISLHTRSPLVLQGGDVALRVILFFMMFLPLAKRFSLDFVLGNEKAPKEKEHSSIFSIAYGVQFLLIWVMSGFLKTGSPWVADMSAVSMALSLDIFTTGIGSWMRQFPDMMRFITFATLVIERYFFVLFFIPFKRDWGRLFGLIAYTLLVLGFNASFRLGLFGMIMFSISLGLLPGIFWDKIVNPMHHFLSGKSKIGLTIFYDGDCGFCLRMVYFIKKILFLKPETIIIESVSDSSAYNMIQTTHSWVVRDTDGYSHTGFKAFVALMQSSFLYRIIAPVFLLKPVLYIGEIFYKMVAHNRPMTCVVDVPYQENKIQKNIHKCIKFLVGLLIIFILAWNLNGLFPNIKIFKARFIEKTLLLFRLDQKWNMFAPYPTTEDGFYVIPGLLRDSSSVNVYTGSSTISYEKPEKMAFTYKDQRWQKYLMNLWLRDFSAYRLGYGQYLCKTWNSNNMYGKNLMTFKIVYILEETDFNTLKEKPLQQVVIWEHNCFP